MELLPNMAIAAIQLIDRSTRMGPTPMDVMRHSEVLQVDNNTGRPVN